jgi:tetratricopeptide (TPR) repeat protein
MKSAATFIDEIEQLISAEHFTEALEKLQYEEAALIPTTQSPYYRKFLKVSSVVFYHNNLGDRALECVSEMEKLYSDISNNFDFILLKSKLLLLEGNTDHAQTLLENAVTKKWSDDEQHWLKFNLGMTFFMKGDYIYSQTLFQEGQDFAESSGNNFLMGYASYMLGYVAFQRCFFKIANEYYHRALELFTTAGKNIQLGNTYKMLGILAYRTSHYSKAQEYLSCAMACYERCSHKIGIINATIAHGRIDIFSGRYREAERLLLESHNPEFLN